MHTAEYEALEKHGCPARMGPDLLVINDPDMIRHFNAPGSKWRRSEWYDAMRFDPRQDTVFSTRDEKTHADMKAKQVGDYNGRDIDTLETDIDARLSDILSLIRTTTVAFGRPFGFIAANEDLWDYSKANAEFFPVLELAANHKFFRWLLATPVVQWLAAPRPTDKAGIDPALAFAQKAVLERFGPDAKVKKDMLGHFVEKGLPQLQCETEAFLQIIAGSDSTTTVLRCTMFLLIANPTAYGKLRAEIDRANREGGLSYPIATYAKTQKLPFLSTCLWEGLRMYPPLFGLKSKLAPSGGDTIKGIYFPAGTEVAICDSSMCRRKDIFGEDSHIYRPERWVEATTEKRQTFQKTVDTIFGSGRFYCLGRHIAMMELHKTFIELMRNFDWMIADPMRAVPSVGHAVFEQRDMNVVARAR